MKKLSVQQMEKFQGGRAAPVKDLWAAGEQCHGYLTILLKYGYDPGDIVGGFWRYCNS